MTNSETSSDFSIELPSDLQSKLNMRSVWEAIKIDSVVRGTEVEARILRVIEAVGVAPQYSSQLGKWGVSLANRHASLPVAYRLYLPHRSGRVTARVAGRRVFPMT